MRRGRLAQLAVEGLPTVQPTPPPLDKSPEELPEEIKPRRNPGRRATSVEARRRKMSEGGEPKPVQVSHRERDVEFELDLFNPEEEA